MGSLLPWLEAAILGVVQGLTEFLPVSSSAHLRILGPLLPSGTDPGAAFTAITQLGTEAAVLVYFRHDIARILVRWWGSLTQPALRRDPDARMGWLILIGTLPIAVLGLLFKDAIETSLRHLAITATMLIVFALLLGWADRRAPQRRTLRELGWGHGLVFGFAQALALIPGVSRSGGTITAGLLMGYTREAAARYSFLLALPAVAASGFYQLYRSWGVSGPIAPGPTALATLIAFVVGYAVIVWFLKLVSTRGYMPFVLYRIALGALVLFLLAAGVLAPL
ncbi:undecaprenyl-diphosphate phosphatase [Hydrogenophaga intermedia]|uniref:undecaprenyl-diphosphate phosphatase n=1 Tax=Hydrogenophaga intermedia TaxID=65786 RepID=UPI002043BC72|nr:undecaprenyl-diphosphate phosphatase [Hydrogenophaga intermedia]MCM3563804.1 undecaprenyl-diphosphate phosphatase [Hydrogenophaga intermedia]